MSRRIVDLPRASEPDLAGALAALDTGLRIALGAAWLGSAAAGTPALLGFSPALAAGLAACGVAALADLWPRASAAAGLALSLLALPAAPAALAPWLALLGAAAARTLLQLGAPGALLERVRVLRRARGAALAACEILRARAAALGAAGAAELGRAGDAFELAGRARSALRELGVEGRPGAALARAAGRVAATLLPGPADAALAARLLAASRSWSAGAGL